MNKAERKRRAKEKKRKGKLAKRAKREPGTAQESTPAAPTEKGRTSGQTQAGAVSPEVSQGDTKATGTPATEQKGAEEARALPSEDEIHMAHGKLNWAEADMLEGELAAKLGDDEAVELLTKAARALGDVIDYVQDLLERVPKDQVAEAIRIQNRPRTYGEKSRNGSNPVVQLLNILVRAEGLMIRVVKQTNPELAKRMKASQPAR